MNDTMTELSIEIQSFVERTGSLMERFGAARTFGRLLGFLLVAERPYSLDELSALLLVSKASISTNTRLLEQSGMAQRVSMPGDRRTFFEILPGSFSRVLEAKLLLIDEIEQLAEAGLDAIDETNTLACQRLEEMRDFYSFAGEEIIGMLAHWKEHGSKRDPSIGKQVPRSHPEIHSISAERAGQKETS